MRFPLGDWIDERQDCRHDLGESGMHGSVRLPPPSRLRFDRSVLGELREELGRHLGVAEDRLALTHGATEANSWVAVYLGRDPSGRGPAVGRVCLPEYPSLVDLLGAVGLPAGEARGPARLAAVSRPRNPEGDLWTQARLFDWAEGARHLLVDETFREFTDEPSVAVPGRPGVWATGTFTKFYGADHLRVGWAVAPPEEADRFARFVGVVSDELSPASAAGAVHLLTDGKQVRRDVRGLVRRNAAYLRRADRSFRPPAGPVVFDRTVEDGDRLADRCWDSSVLVCPGRFFGDPRGVRLGLTRRTFPVDLDAYLSVRKELEGATPDGTVRPTGARPHRAEGNPRAAGRARAAPRARARARSRSRDDAP